MLQVPNKGDQPARPRVDWDAVERDYRTGRFTLRELERMHGRSAGQICRRAQAEGWTQDLRELVRQATSAAIIRDLAAAATTGAQQSATQQVLAVAEVIKDVTLRHRKDVAAARAMTMDLLAELQATTMSQAELQRFLATNLDEATPERRAEMLRQFGDLLKLHTRIASMQKLSDAMQRTQTLERRAFGISDDDTGATALDSMSDTDLEAEIERLAAIRRGD